MPLTALLVLAGQVGGATAATLPPRSALQCAGVRVTASDQTAPPKDMTFSSRETLDLLFRPRVKQNLQGEHLMQLKVFTPGGFLYQVLTVPFVGETQSGGRERPGWVTNRMSEKRENADTPPTRVVPGFPRPLEVQRLVPPGGARGEYELRARLPVAGTSITLSSLYGTWSVQPYLDGAAEPCGPATRFKIRE
jgi:hypothetical protein